MGNNPAPSQLFKNNGDGTFTDVAAEAGSLIIDTQKPSSGEIMMMTWIQIYMSRAMGTPIGFTGTMETEPLRMLPPT